MVAVRDLAALVWRSAASLRRCASKAVRDDEWNHTAAARSAGPLRRRRMPGIDALSAATGCRRTHARTALLAKPITAVPSTSLTVSPALNATTNPIAILAPPRGKHDDRTPMATLVLGPS